MIFSHILSKFQVLLLLSRHYIGRSLFQRPMKTMKLWLISSKSTQFVMQFTTSKLPGTKLHLKTCFVILSKKLKDKERDENGRIRFKDTDLEPSEERKMIGDENDKINEIRT